MMNTPLTPDPPAPRDGRARMTPEQRAEIIRRLDAGEKASRLAREYGVSRQAIANYRKEEDGKLQGAANKKMTTAETEQMCRLMTDSIPSDHGLVEGLYPDRWTPAQAQELAEKLFGRELYLLQFKELIADIFPPDGEHRRHGRAREPMTFEEIKAVMARHTGFSKPAEAASPAETPVRKPGRPRGLSSDDFAMPPPEMWETLEPSPFNPRLPVQSPVPGPVRTGKHRGSKGSPFTKARKKKKH